MMNAVFPAGPEGIEASAASLLASVPLEPLLLVEPASGGEPAVVVVPPHAAKSEPVANARIQPTLWPSMRGP